MDERFPLALPEGTILAGQYMIEKVLGQGGFGITYRAIDHKTNQKVAVKEFFPDTLAYREVTTVISYPGERSESYEYGKESFLQEAKTLAEFIGNENIVRIHSYFEENGTAYFVMDYIEGKSFDVYIKERGGRISVEEAKAILIPMMDALNIVHSKGIVHRDVTPDNIYLTNDGTVKLLDFGAARYSLGDKSRSLDVILKHGFAPKEQYTRRGKQGPFTDIYSLGATFYFAITGKRPPDSVERLDEDDLILPSNLGVEITEYQERAILQAMSVQPADRFQTMADFKRVLLNESADANQMFFTAPETAAEPPAYQAAPAVQQGYPTTQQGIPIVGQGSPEVQQGFSAVQQAVQPAETVQKKGKTKKKLIIGIVGALVVVFLIGRAFSGNKADKAANRASSGAVKEEVTYDVSELVIVGNTAANIRNGGIYTISGNRQFWCDEDCHALMRDNSEYVYEYSEKEFSCLSYYDGILYFLYDGSAYMRDMTEDSSEIPIPELEAYGSIQSLYVTTGCYFIYADEKLYRISRKTGMEEEFISISYPENIAFDNGWLYYIGTDSDGRSAIYKVSASDFSNYPANNLNTSNGYFSYPFVDGDYIYVLWNDGSQASLWVLYSDMQVHGDEPNVDLSKMLNEYGQDDRNYICQLNIINDAYFHAFVTVCNAVTNSNYIYHMQVGDNNSTELLSANAYAPCVSKQGSNCVVNALVYDEEEGMWVNRYKQY